MSLALKGQFRDGRVDKRYYMIRLQVDGRRVVISSGTGNLELAQAREQAVYVALRDTPLIRQAELVALIRGDDHGRHAAAVRAVMGVTLAEAFKRCFLDPQVWGLIRSKALYLCVTRQLESYFGRDRAIGTIGASDIKGFIQALLAKGSAPGTINCKLACLTRMFSAMRELPDGPKSIPKFTLLKGERPRTFTLSHEQEDSVLKAIAALDRIEPGPQGGSPRKRDAYRYLPLYVVLVESGLRLGEALGLRWSDVTMTRTGAVIRLHRTRELKNGKARTVPMTERCRQAFGDLARSNGQAYGPFCDLDKRRAQRIWTQGVAATDIDDRECVIHCLRHTCATRLLRATGNIVLVRDWLSWSSNFGHADRAYQAARRSASLGER